MFLSVLFSSKFKNAGCQQNAKKKRKKKNIPLPVITTKNEDNIALHSISAAGKV